VDAGALKIPYLRDLHCHLRYVALGLVILGKLAQVIVPAVRKLSEENRALFLEAERRSIHNELASLEHEIEDERSKLEEKERALGNVTEELKRFR